MSRCLSQLRHPRASSVHQAPVASLLLKYAAAHPCCFLSPSLNYSIIAPLFPLIGKSKKFCRWRTVQFKPSCFPVSRAVLTETVAAQRLPPNFQPPHQCSRKSVIILSPRHHQVRLSGLARKTRHPILASYCTAFSFHSPTAKLFFSVMILSWTIATSSTSENRVSRRRDKHYPSPLNFVSSKSTQQKSSYKSSPPSRRPEQHAKPDEPCSEKCWD